MGGAPQEKAWPTEQPLKRVRLNSDEEILEEGVGEEVEALSDQSGSFERDYQRVDQPRAGPKFSEKMIEEYQSPWQPSATPKYLQHRFMVSIISGGRSGVCCAIAYFLRCTILWVWSTATTMRPRPS